MLDRNLTLRLFDAIGRHQTVMDLREEEVMIMIMIMMMVVVTTIPLICSIDAVIVSIADPYNKYMT